MRMQHYRPRRRKGNLIVLSISIVCVSCLLVYACIKATSNLPDVGLGFQSSLQGELVKIQSDLRNITEALNLEIVEHQKLRAQSRSTNATFAQQLDKLSAQNKVLSEQLQKWQTAGSEMLWLVIGIPTVPRKNDTDYLTTTLNSLLAELPLDSSSLLWKRVKIVVMNNRPHQHIIFSRVRARVERGRDSDDIFVKKAGVYIEFVDNLGNWTDPTPNAIDPDDYNNPKNLPGRQVRRQTGDLITLLEMSHPLSHYYLFMEDDFRVCPNMIRILSYVLQKMSSVAYYGNWLGLRLSYGMNGILMKSKDLPLLISYLRKHTARLPPDLLWIEFYQSRRPEVRVNKGRKLAVYRFNLMEHMGEKSSFLVRANRPDWPRCFDPMAHVWSLAKTETFNERRCGHSDIYPCPLHDIQQDAWLKNPISWPNISTEVVEKAEPLKFVQSNATPNKVMPVRVSKVSENKTATAE